MRVLLLSLLTIVLLTVASLAFAQVGPPGCPCPAGTAPNFLELREGPTDQFSDEHAGPVPLPYPAVPGFVVLYEQPIPNLQDPHNWSDVLVFANGHAPQPGECAFYATFCSETPNSAGQEVGGISDADLAPAGVTVADVVAGNTVYLQESVTSDLNRYTPPCNAVYYVHSDPPEIIVPTKGSTWGKIKMMYR